MKLISKAAQKLSELIGTTERPMTLVRKLVVHFLVIYINHDFWLVSSTIKKNVQKPELMKKSGLVYSLLW